MKKILGFFLLLISPLLIAQESGSLTFDGNFRYAYIGNDTNGSGLENGIHTLRTRIGLRYILSEQSSFRARLASTFSDELEAPKLTIRSDGGGRLAFGSISFDELYYRFQNDDYDVKLGRFQHTIGVRSNAGRSLMRFQSNLIFVNWTDGAYFKRNLENGWYGEFIGEYQPKGYLSYPYQGPLNFGNNDHNFNAYFGIENRERDENNIIQKGFGLFVAPNAYLKNGDYSTYTAITSRIAIDLPQNDLLRGGSWRIAGEFGQNLSTSIENGTMAIISVGVNRFAEKHEFMVEFVSTDEQWLLANVFARNGEEIELRYRFFATKDLNFDARYRIRSSNNETIPNFYNTFIRATYSF
ncbi:MAG: hypothetical protein BalsKO_04890 [Balneolaceae bacterium]